MRRGQANKNIFFVHLCRVQIAIVQCRRGSALLRLCSNALDTYSPPLVSPNAHRPFLSPAPQAITVFLFSLPPPSLSPRHRPATRTKRTGKEVESLHHQLLNRGHSNPTISIQMLLNKPGLPESLSSLFFSFSSFLSFFPSFLPSSFFDSYGFFVSYRESLIENVFSLCTRDRFFSPLSLFLSLASLVGEEYS